jgi:hypothetical protein
LDSIKIPGMELLPSWMGGPPDEPDGATGGRQNYSTLKLSLKTL